MKALTDSTPSSTVQDAARIRAHGRSVRRLGHWTTARRIDVRASRSSVILDLRSHRIEAGDIEIDLDVDGSMVKLLVPEDAVVDHDDVRRVGRCGLVDWGGVPAPGGRAIRLGGEMRRSELRVNRGGIAIVSAMLTGEYLADLKEAYQEGRWTTIDDPGRQS